MAFLLATLLLALLPPAASGLTIYRIGGDPAYVHPMAGTVQVPFYEATVDGDLLTHMSPDDVGRAKLTDELILFLGGSFPVNRVVIRTRPDHLEIQLPGGKVADATVDLDNWSYWSGSYAFAERMGAPIVSPGPRRYVQLQVEFLPLGRDGCGLDALEFEVTDPPVAGRVVGEIWPVRVAPAQETAFTYAVLPSFSGGEGGFDRLLLQTPGQFTRVDSAHIVGVPVQWSLVEPADDGRVMVQLGERIEQFDRGKLMEVFFHGRVFHYGTVFSGQVFDSERPMEVGQYVEDGDATLQMDSNRRVVDVALGNRFIGETAALPRVITPDGDGVSDRLMIRHTVLLLAGAADVQVDILDLSGRRVAEVCRGDDSSGRYQREWDGRRSGGKMVPPGIYLYRVGVHMDADREERAGLVSVVY